MIRLRQLQHVRFSVADPTAEQRFLNDFGLQLVSHSPQRFYMAGMGGAPCCYIGEPGERNGLLGIGFEVADFEELERAVREHGAAPIQPLDGPGGGMGTRLRDPCGFEVELVHGVAPVPAGAPLRADLQPNAGLHKTRRGLRQMEVVPPPGPAQVLRLGHFALFTRRLAETEAWYRDVLGLLRSDVMHTGQADQPIAVFLRLDRGDAWVDHHTLFLLGGEADAVHHVSFEVQDYEAQFRTHRWLLGRGWSPIWGVGRHPLGSHVFDLWRSPGGQRFETYSDTDLLQAQHPAGSVAIHETEIDLWSSEPPGRYFA